MSSTSSFKSGTISAEARDVGWQPAPGKATRSQAVQRKAGAAAEADSAAVHQAAQAGIAEAGGKLPFYDQIQASFGAHDVSGISAHVGGSASEACQAMGAQAYATGHHVAFGGAPDLHTAAHEAAHVVQQRGGVQLSRGVGQAGDEHEQHADRVADQVVAGRSAEGLLDAYGRHGGGAAQVQHRLIVGKKVIQPDEIDQELDNAEKLKAIDPLDRVSTKRLVHEAGAKEDYHYDTWKDATRGVRQHDLGKYESVAIKRGGMVFTNVAKPSHAKAEQLLELLERHPSIQAYLNGRPCFFSLVNDKGNPASVIDLGKQVNIEVAYWYFDTYELGYMLGMLMHEFAVHPMADDDKGVLGDEKGKIGTDLPTGVKHGKTEHTVNTKGAGQQDHIFAATWGEQRQGVYLRAVLDMAMVLVAETMKKDSKVKPEQIRNLLDCFLMDCASILGTNDHRGWGPFYKGLIASIYNEYLQRLAALVDKLDEIKTQLPAPKDPGEIFGDYKSALGNLIKGSFGKNSCDTEHYQPTEKQLNTLEKAGYRLHWIEPDGRCVFGAIGFIKGMSAREAIEEVLDCLNFGVSRVTDVIKRAGLTVEDVAECIRQGRWADPKVGDVILEVVAVALTVGVTIVMPNGSLWPVNGGGRYIVRVTSPLEHYHAAGKK